MGETDVDREYVKVLDCAETTRLCEDGPDGAGACVLGVFSRTCGHCIRYMPVFSSVAKEVSMRKEGGVLYSFCAFFVGGDGGPCGGVVRELHRKGVPVTAVVGSRVNGGRRVADVVTKLGSMEAPELVSFIEKNAPPRTQAPDPPRQDAPRHHGGEPRPRPRASVLLNDRAAAQLCAGVRATYGKPILCYTSRYDAYDRSFWQFDAMIKDIFIPKESGASAACNAFNAADVSGRGILTPQVVLNDGRRFVGPMAHAYVFGLVDKKEGVVEPPVPVSSVFFERSGALALGTESLPPSTHHELMLMTKAQETLVYALVVLSAWAGKKKKTMLQRTIAVLADCVHKCVSGDSDTPHVQLCFAITETLRPHECIGVLHMLCCMKPFVTGIGKKQGTPAESVDVDAEYEAWTRSDRRLRDRLDGISASTVPSSRAIRGANGMLMHATEEGGSPDEFDVTSRETLDRTALHCSHGDKLALVRLGESLSGPYPLDEDDVLTNTRTYAACIGGLYAAWFPVYDELFKTIQN